MNTLPFVVLALSFVAYFYCFWLLYLAVMNIYRVHLKGELAAHRARWFCYFAVGLGYAADFIGNLLMTIVFLDLPKEWLVTARMDRYKREENGWRKRLAEFVCETFLDIFDPTGRHCGK